MMMTTEEILEDVFQTVFDDPSIELRPGMTANDVEGWDSLSHVNLILAIELRFDIHFSQKELLTFKTVGDLINSINRKLA
jgi:acyl carrier protein